MERKKRSKGSVWEFCYANKIVGTFGDEMSSFGQKLVKFCTHTHTHTHAAQLVVRMCYVGNGGDGSSRQAELNLNLAERPVCKLPKCPN